VVEAANFRDFRKKKGKPANGLGFTVKEPAPPGQEPGLVPDIPRDITPEELDALSALAAKLDGPIPEAEDISLLAETMGPAAAAENAAAQTAAAKIEVAKLEAAKMEAANAEPVRPESAISETAKPVAAAADGDSPAPAVESKTEVEIPAEHLEPPSEAAADSTSAGQYKTGTDRLPSSETQPPEMERAEASSVVNVIVSPALLTQESMPVDPSAVDKTDEARLVPAANAIEQQAMPEEKDQKIEVKPAEAVAEVGTSEASTPPETAVTPEPDSKIQESKVPESEPETLIAEESRAEQGKTGESKATDSEDEKAAQPVAVAPNLPAPVEAEEPVPSDEELAEALRLLTPATVSTGISTVPSHGTLVAAGQLLAEEVARNTAAGPRWVAEPMALSPEEAAISLEAEMFGTFATTFMASSTATPAPIGTRGTTRITGVSAIAAAVENRLAEAEIAASARAVAEQQAEPQVADQAESTLAGTSTVATLGEAAPPDSNKIESSALSPAVEQIAAEIATRTTIAPDKPAVERREGDRRASSVKVAETIPEEEVATATFADAGCGGNENEGAPTITQQSTESVGVATPAVSAAVASDENPVNEENQESSSDSRSEESMGKDGKSGTWHQIRTTPAGGAANTNLVEAAKQAEVSTEQAPKAMAAAAADGSAFTSTTDASTIASIVDSVMADLRPRIVEEIAKKLSGK
jgi:hypothetical protein